MKLDKVLVATDFSDQSQLAVTEATNVARIHGASLAIVHVEHHVEPYPSGGQIPGSALKEVAGLVDENRKLTKATLEALANDARDAGVETTTHITSGHPDEAIVEAAEELGADLVVTGTHGRSGFRRLLMGSIAEKVVRMSHTNVLVARGDTSGNFQRILVPTDFSTTSERALRVAMSLAPDGARVELFHSWQYPGGVHGLSSPDQTTGPLGELYDSIIADNDRRADEWLKIYAREGIALEFVQTHGSASQAIHTRIEDEGDYNLVCMGTHGYRGFRRFMLGSVAEATVRHSTCSVLVVRAQPGDGD